jgi:hypothetical protein
MGLILIECLKIFWVGGRPYEELPLVILLSLSFPTPASKCMTAKQVGLALILLSLYLLVIRSNLSWDTSYHD